MNAAVLKLSRLTTPGAAGHGRLDGLNFAPVPGALTALLGPAGAGKSALIRAVAGFGRVRGTLELDGTSIARIAAHRRGFGMVLQPDMLFPELTLAENVAFPLQSRKLPIRDKRRLVGEALQQVGLHGAGSVRAEAATALQVRQAMLARAVVFGPRLLLLDEPFATLVFAERATLVVTLRRIHNLLGMTVLLATTAAQDALAASDHLAILREGAITQTGTTAEVFDQPRNDAVAVLLGEVNRLPGHVVEIDDDLAVIRLACGPLVEVASSLALAVGDPCVMILRPDRIAIASAAASEMGGHALDATLIEAQFMGDSYRLRLLIGSGAEMVVRRPAAAGLRGLSVGSAASIAWQPHNAQACRSG